MHRRGQESAAGIFVSRPLPKDMLLAGTQEESQDTDTEKERMVSESTELDRGFPSKVREGEAGLHESGPTKQRSVGGQPRRVLSL